MSELDERTVEAMQAEGWTSPEETAALRGELEALERDRFVVWEGDESEGHWRCLMCGAKREGDEDTGPEGVDHWGLCGEPGQKTWAYTRILAPAQQQAMKPPLTNWTDDPEGRAGAAEGD